MAEIITTFCGICERACGMQAEVVNGEIVRLGGYREHLRSKGELCVKGRAALDIARAPDRLRFPLKRENGSWKRISWDKALDLLTHTLTEIKERYGAQSLAVYHGQTYLKNCAAMFCMKRFLRLYGTPNLCSAASECFIPHLLNGIATYGGLAFADVEHSKCIIIWGSNPFASGSLFGGNIPLTVRLFNGLKERGVTFIVIDPRTPTITSLADLHLRVRPGSDGALALGMMRVLIEEGLYDKDFVERYASGFDAFREMVMRYEPKWVEEITWVPRKEMEKAARLFATNSPASIIPGVGVEHHTNAVQTLRALSLLLTLTGNIDRKGGNTFLTPVMLASADVEDVPALEEHPLGMEEHPMFVSMINQAQALVVIDRMVSGEESPVKGFIVAGGAPIPQLANTNKVKEALHKVDFMAVIDLFMTETARYADLVLPAAFFLERDEIATMPLNLQRKVVDGGECWPDWKLWWELAKKMGYGKYFPWNHLTELMEFLLEPTGVSYADLKAHPEGIAREVPPGTFLENGFYTYSGKIEFYSHSLASNGYDPLPVYQEPLESLVSTPELARDYPFILITGGRLPMYLHSQHRTIPSLKKLHPEPYLEIHPDSARGLGVKNEDQVMVESPRGCLVVKARLTEGILPQVVHLPHGWADADCNLLTDHRKRDPISGFPGLKSSLCRVRKV